MQCVRKNPAPWRAAQSGNELFNMLIINVKIFRITNDYQLCEAAVCAAHRPWGSMRAQFIHVLKAFQASQE
jgi:hypothetical protein